MTKRMKRTILLACSIILFSWPAGAGQIEKDYCYNEAGMYYDVSPILLKSISKVESSYKPNAVNYNKNGSVDVGHMQINSCWKDSLGTRWNYLGNPCYNTYVGAWILKQCQVKHGNTWDAVACYNSGRPLSALKGDTLRKVTKYVYRVADEIYGGGSGK